MASQADWLNTPDNNINAEFLHKKHETYGRVFNNITEVIGNTPLVRLNNIPKSYGLKCEILVKCEYLNPGGSVKDRIGQRMIEDAEKLNFIKPGYTLIEATSGNAGIGLCMTAAVKGYNMIITLPEKMSQEKVNVMKGLGAKIIRTPTEAAWDSPESHIEVAKRTRDSLENAVILDQYNNSSNPVAHYDHTGQEIVDQTGGKLDYFFASLGTGGTMTGCASKIKEKIPTCKCIGIDPHGSILAQPEELNKIQASYHVEGIGYDFIPNTCVRQHVDEWIKTDDEESFAMARRLIREEGLLVGGSSGSAVSAVINYALKNNLNENHRIVVILPDSVRNYINKFLSDDWMVDKGFLSTDIYVDKESKLYGKKARELNLPAVKSYDNKLTVKEAFEIFDQGADVIPIVEGNRVKSALFANKFLAGVQAKKLGPTDTIERLTTKDFIAVDIDTDLSVVQKLLDRHTHILVEEKKGDSVASYSVVTIRHIFNLCK